jgi:hypothetical protein
LCASTPKKKPALSPAGFSTCAAASGARSIPIDGTLATRGEIGVAIAEHDAARLIALATAEQHATAMVEAMAEVITRSDLICAAARATGAAPPLALDRGLVRERLSQMLVRALDPVRSGARSFGVMEWPAFYRGDAAGWVELERRASAAGIAELMSGERASRSTGPRARPDGVTSIAQLTERVALGTLPCHAEQIAAAGTSGADALGDARA